MWFGFKGGKNCAILSSPLSLLEILNQPPNSEARSITDALSSVICAGLGQALKDLWSPSGSLS